VIIGIIDTVFADSAEVYRKDARRGEVPPGGAKEQA
jgi:hypothetical protein